MSAVLERRSSSTPPARREARIEPLGDGVLLVSTLADGDVSTKLALLDPRAMECVATVELPQVVRFGVHGAFQPA